LFLRGQSCSTPLSVWPHLFCGAGHEKRRGEQLKWSLAFWLYIGMGDAHHCSGPPISEMTCTVSSGALNSTIPYHTMLHPKGWGPSIPHFGGSVLLMCTPFVTELPNMTWQHVGEGHMCLGFHHTSYPNTAELQGCPILGFSLPVPCITMIKFTQNSDSVFHAG